MNLSLFLILAVAVVIALYIFAYKLSTSGNDVLVLADEAPIEEVQAAPVIEEEPVKKPKTAKAEMATKRTRKAGKFVGDDKSTPDVNEAFTDGKTPEEKPRVKSSKKKPDLKVAK